MNTTGSFRLKRALYGIALAVVFCSCTLCAQSYYELYRRFLAYSFQGNTSMQQLLQSNLEECAAINPTLIYYYLRTIPGVLGHEPISTVEFSNRKMHEKTVLDRWARREADSAEASRLPRYKVSEIRSLLEEYESMDVAPESEKSVQDLKPNMAYFYTYIALARDGKIGFDSSRDYRKLCRETIEAQMGECDKRLADSAFYSEDEKLSFAREHLYCFNEEYLQEYDLIPHRRFYTYAGAAISPGFVPRACFSIGLMTPYALMTFRESMVTGNTDIDTHLASQYEVSFSTLGQPFILLSFTIPTATDQGPFSLIRLQTAYSPAAAALSEDLPSGAIFKGIYGFPGLGFNGAFYFNGITGRKMQTLFLEARTPIWYYNKWSSLDIGAGTRIYDLRYSYSIRMEGGYSVWDNRYLYMTTFKNSFDVRRIHTSIYGSVCTSIRLFSLLDFTAMINTDLVMQAGLSYPIGI